MKLEDVQVGMWVSDANGVYQVMEEYDSFHKWYVCKEIIWDDGDSGEYHLEKYNTYITKEEMKKCEYYGVGEMDNGK